MIRRLAAALACWWVLTGVALAGPKYEVRVLTGIDYLPSAVYAEDKDKLDLYLPVGQRGFPVIVSLYGGGLRQGDKSKETHIGQRFAAAGVGVAVVNYRLSPAVAHPAHAQDVAAALAWVKSNIARHGGNPNAVFLIGHSAGAYLTALLATDARYLAAHQLKPTDLAGFVPVSGFFWVEKVAPDRPKDTWGTDPAAWPAASPAKYVAPNAPPIFLLYADKDDEWRRQQNEEFAAALRKAGNQGVQVRMIPNRTHTEIWQNMRNEEEASAAILEFVAARTKGGTAP
jgi:acetyl esterase/lipase